VERCFRILFCITLSSCLPFVFVSRDRQMVFGIVISSVNEAVSKCLKMSVIVFIFIVVLWRAENRKKNVVSPVLSSREMLVACMLFCGYPSLM
jgi:hypothetical protein